MKLPKLRSPLTTATPVGEAKLRALGQTDAPYLRTRGVGYTARKRGMFDEVITDEPEQQADNLYLWANPIGTSAWIVNAAPRKRSKTIATAPLAGGTFPLNNNGVALWVGDNRLVFLRWDEDDIWPVLAPPNKGAEVTPTDPLADRAAISFYGSRVLFIETPYTGSSAAGLSTYFATGWSDGSYRWGAACMSPRGASSASPPVVATGVAANEPSVKLSTTRPTAEMSTVSMPTEAGRVHYGGRVFCAGPGKLISLVTVAEQFNSADPTSVSYIKPQIAPYLCISADHGATWTRTTASFLTGLLAQIRSSYPGPLTFAGERLVWENNQLRNVAESFTAAYIGGGVTLFFISRLGTTYGGYDSIPDTTDPVACFRYESGSVSAVAWPGDSGSGTFDTYGTTSTWFTTASGCFGPGCFVGTYRVSGALRLISTRDDGTSWTTSAAVPWLLVAPPVVISPYKTPDNPGKILFVGRTVTDSTPHVWQTTGDFAAFADLGVLSSVVGGTTYAIPYKKRTKLSLALPDEFNAP